MTVILGHEIHLSSEKLGLFRVYRGLGDEMYHPVIWGLFHKP